MSRENDSHTHPHRNKLSIKNEFKGIQAVLSWGTVIIECMLMRL